MGFLPRRLGPTPDAPRVQRPFATLGGQPQVPQAPGAIPGLPGSASQRPMPTAPIQLSEDPTATGRVGTGGGGGFNEGGGTFGRLAGTTPTAVGSPTAGPPAPTATTPAAPSIGGADRNQIAAYQQQLHANPQYQQAWAELQQNLQHLPEFAANEGITGENPSNPDNPQDPLDLARRVMFERFATQTKGLITLPKDYMINPMDGSLTYVPPDHAGRNQLFALGAFIGGGALAGYLGGLGAAAPTAAGAGGGAAAGGGALASTATTSTLGALAPELASGTSAAGLGLGGTLATGAGLAGATAPLAATATAPATGSLVTGGTGSAVSSGAAAGGAAAGGAAGSSGIPWWARLAGTTGAALISKWQQGQAGQRSPEELAALSGATGAANTLTNQGKGLTASGMTAINQGLPSLQKAGDYYNTLLGGNRSAMALATAGPRASITDTYRGAERGIERSGARGGVRDLAKAELSRSRAGDISGLTTGVQPAAAAGLTDVGARTSAVGLGLTGQGTQALSGAGSLFGSLLNSGAQNRMYARSEGDKAGTAWGSLIFDLLSGYYGKK